MGFLSLSGLSGLRFALLVMGFTATAFQILIIRELLITFHGNELFIGIILGNWLILEAAGSYFLRKRADRTERHINWFVLLQTAVGVSSILSILFIRSFRYIFNISTGEFLGIHYAAIVSFIALMPAFLDGALFPLGCRNIYAFAKKEEVSARVYLYQSAGSLAAGLAFVFYLIYHLNSIGLAFIVLSLNLCSVILYLTALGKLKPLRNAAIAAVMLAGISFLISAPDWLHGFSSRILWHEHHLVDTRNSVYSNIAVIKKQGQYTFFANGSPYATTPMPEAQIEELAHFPMLFHERPDDVLIIGGGAGGLLREVLKHPVKEVHYAEHDPLVIESFRRFTTPVTEYELNHEKVKIHLTEGRLFLKKTQSRYDIIILNLPIPSTVQLNRYYSAEFFELVKRRLKDGGILSLHLPGSETFLSGELKELNRTIYASLNNIFPQVRIIAGDRNIFIGSGDISVNRVTDEMLIKRLHSRDISSGLVNEWYIRYKTQKIRFGRLADEIAVSEGQTLNQDGFPRGVWESMVYLNLVASPFMVRVLHALNNIHYAFYLASAIAAGMVFMLMQKKRGGQMFLGVAVISTGFISMLINIVLIILFQVYYGYVYHYIGILTSVFMLGGALGAFFAMKKTKTSLLLIEKGMLALVVFVYLFLLLNPEGVLSLLMIFSMMCAAGFFTAAEYPLAVNMSDSLCRTPGSSAGRFYAMDLMGAFLGAIITSVIFIPTIGIKNTLLLAIAVKSGSLLTVKQGIVVNPKKAIEKMS